MRVYCGLPRERSKLKKCTLKEHLFQIAGCELAIRSESARPVPSCVTEPPLCHSLTVTGALISDSTIFKAGQKPVTRMSLQSSLLQIMRHLLVTALLNKLQCSTTP